MDYSFRHLDPSVTKTYRGTVLYGFEARNKCFLLKVRNGYLIESPPQYNRINKYAWCRGQHIDTLATYFKQIRPIRIVHDAY